MGLHDRDYWKERYDENLGVKKEKRLNSLKRLRFFRSGPRVSMPAHEFSFIGKLAITIGVLLSCAIVYRLLR